MNFSSGSLPKLLKKNCFYCCFIARRVKICAIVLSNNIYMKETMQNQEDTPRSSLNNDEITAIAGNAMFYVEEVEEIDFEDGGMEDLTDQEEEDIDMDPPEDHAKLVFSKHIGSVFCCDLHPDGKLAVTGGEDDKAFVWSIETGRVVSECVGEHKDSVIFVGFSHDGTYLATADMSGLIQVWKCNLDENQQEPWAVAFQYVTDDVTWAQWHFAAKVLIVGCDSGDIYIFKVPSGEIKVLKGNTVKAECGKLFPDGVRLAAGYEDGAVKIWDLKTTSVVHALPNRVHNIRVTAVDVQPENNLMASISSDGKAVLITPSNGKVVGQLEIENDLETVSFAPELGLVAFGTLTGAVSVWDVARQMMRHQCAKSDDNVVGVTKMIWIKDLLLTGCLDGSIRGYNGLSGEMILNLTGHRSEVLDLCYSAKHDTILTTSEDGTARIFASTNTSIPQ